MSAFIWQNAESLYVLWYRGLLLISWSIDRIESKRVASTIAKSSRRSGKIVCQLSSVTRVIAFDLSLIDRRTFECTRSRQVHNQSGWLHPENCCRNFHLTDTGIVYLRCTANCCAESPCLRHLGFSFLLIKPRTMLRNSKLERTFVRRSEILRVFLFRAPSSERIYDGWRLSIASRSLFPLEGALIFEELYYFLREDIVAVQTLLCAILRKKFRITITLIFYIILE